MNALQNYLAAWFRPERVRHERWEEWIMRLAFAALIWRGYPQVTNFTGQPRPNGLAHWIDFTFFSNAQIVGWLQGVFVAALVLYVLGRWRWIALPVLTALIVARGTLGNSQGAINHGTQIMALVMLGQTLSAWHSAFWLKRRIPDPREFVQQANDNLIRASLQVIAAVYVVSGITKLVNSGGEWIRNVPNLAVQFGKNLDMAYYNSITAPPGNTEAVISFVTNWPNVARGLFGMGLVLELFAFLLLLNRKWAAAMGLSLLLMHESITRIMHLGFLYNKLLLLIFCINLPFWIVWAVRKYRKPSPAS